MLGREGRPAQRAWRLPSTGRIAKTLHLLWVVDPVDDTYRRQMNRQLTVQESRHKLARDICHGKRGQIMQAYREGQEDQLGALGLVLNAAVLWTTRYTDAAVTQIQALLSEERDHDVLDADVARLSPLKQANLNVLGRRPTTPAGGGLLPLRTPAVEEDEEDPRQRRIVRPGCDAMCAVTDSVATSWSRITSWLSENAPAAAERQQGPASADAVSVLRDEAGFPLPADLDEWLSVSNGFSHRGSFGSLLPVLHTPLPAEEMAPRRKHLREVLGSEDESGGADPAGTPSRVWLDAFLPIADSGTDSELFIDLRSGDLSGCVAVFDGEGGGYKAHAWASIAEMLNDVADAMTLGRPALGDYARRHSTEWYSMPSWEIQVLDGRLDWNPATAAP